VTRARQEEIWDVDAAQRYDTPGTGMFAPEVLGPTVDRLAELAGDGPALEFAIGTGRVAVPLAERAVRVTGIELSGPMIEQLRTKADEARVPVVLGDMVTARAPGEYSLVYLVYNSISNLLTQAEQVACFRNAARHLIPGGRLRSSCGCPSCAGFRRDSKPPSGIPNPGTSAWTRTTCCTSTSSRTTSGSVRARGQISTAARTATSGRPNST
jgi:SAM-dependent methyltransferase